MVLHHLSGYAKDVFVINTMRKTALTPSDQLEAGEIVREVLHASVMADRTDEGRQEALNMAWRAVDACGGRHALADLESGYAAGFNAALDAICQHIEQLGGRPS